MRGLALAARAAVQTAFPGRILSALVCSLRSFSPFVLAARGGLVFPNKKPAIDWQSRVFRKSYYLSFRTSLPHCQQIQRNDAKWTSVHCFAGQPAVL
jgi:hypothetical protein